MIMMILMGLMALLVLIVLTRQKDKAADANGRLVQPQGLRNALLVDQQLLDWIFRRRFLHCRWQLPNGFGGDGLVHRIHHVRATQPAGV